MRKDDFMTTATLSAPAPLADAARAQHEAQVRALQAALAEGLASGTPQPLDWPAFEARKLQQFERRNATASHLA